MRAVAAKGVEVPFVQAFADRFVRGSSHPKEFRRLPPLEWAEPVNGSAVLIDDLVTSGWHMEEALALLRARGLPSFGAAWIGGSAEDADPTLNLPAWCRDLPGYVTELEAK